MTTIAEAQTDAPVEEGTIYLRGYVVREKQVQRGAFDHDAEEVDAIPPGDWTLTFDCETGIDAAQALRFGAYQLRRNGVLAKNGAGLFHAEGISDEDLAVLRDFAAAHDMRLMTVRKFVDWIFFDRIYLTGGVVVGFNLPFDIARLALDHGSARSSMKGGFSFNLSRNTDWPRVRVKHVSSRMAFIRFGAPPKKRPYSTPPRRGSFVDVKTLAGGVLSGGFDLLTLSNDILKVEHPKFDVDEHGGPLTPEYIAYGVRDVQATWECYEALTSRLAGYDLSTIEPKTLYSEASLGKAYLKQMGVRPWRDLQPDFPPEMIGQIMSAYFGGRAEVHIRRRKTQVLYCDFLSMYPTVCTLMGLWRFVIAKGTRWRDATAEIQGLIDRIGPADLLRPEAWRDLTVLVQLRPDDDVLPVRRRYGQEPSSNIGVNRLSRAEPLWFTLADVIASKILNGDKAPIIEHAVRFDPEDQQGDLQAINVAGNPDFHVDPTTTDFYRRVIELRQTVKARRDQAEGIEKERLDAEQLALKILANATSYGIFIEMIVKDLDKSEILAGYGVDGRAFDVYTKKYEDPGYFFHPLLATLITGAARLMLALAERRTLDAGLDWVFCDTDSLAIAKPGDMAEDDFIAAAREVCAGFAELNPYENPNPDAQKPPILQVEEHNFAPGYNGDWSAAAQPLYCLAVSAKRYVLFNEDANGEPIIRKASAHGLGHLSPPYQDPDKKRRAKRLKDLKVDLWQEDLWNRIIVAANHPDDTDGGAVIDLGDDPRLSAPVASRWAATAPALLDWFKVYNRGRPYETKVRPFNFLLRFQAEKIEQIASADPEAHKWWLKHRREPAPAAPYDRDPAKAAKHAFDRLLHSFKIPERWLLSYVDALSDYHLQPENKFLGGEIHRASGTLRRRHIKATAVQHIGKETQDWEEQLHTGEDDGDILYGLTPEARATLVNNIAQVRKRFSIRKYMKAAHVTDRTLARAVKGMASDKELVHLAEVGSRLMVGLEEYTAEEAALWDWAWEQAMYEGIYAFAARVGIDGSNFSKAIDKRKFSAGMFAKLRTARTADGGNA
jgi:hypothetical protein